MGAWYFLVNTTKQEYLDSSCKFGELCGDADLVNHFFRLLLKEWKGDRIEILPDFDDWGGHLGYTKIKVDRDDGD